MPLRRIHLALLAALAVGCGVTLPHAVLAAETHSHAAHATFGLEVELNNGRKWPTDDALRQGTAAIRDSVEAALHDSADGKLSQAEAASLVASLRKQVDYIVTNCKLPEAADHQLHFILAHLLEGSELIEREPGSELGLTMILVALDTYGQAFDHPGWEPFRAE